MFYNNKCLSLLIVAVTIGVAVETFPVSETVIPAIAKLMSRRRCGSPDFTHKTNGGNGGGLTESQHTGFKWEKNNLTWTFDRSTYENLEYKTITVNDILYDFEQAIKFWTSQINLTITYNENVRDADIVLSFFSGHHRDGYPFDGRGVVIAHAFFPPNGAVHFDADELWIERSWELYHDLNNTDYTSFYSIAVHEIGHALGFVHVPFNDSIMFPWYRTLERTYTISERDRYTAQLKYGSRANAVSKDSVYITNRVDYTPTVSSIPKNVPSTLDEAVEDDEDDDNRKDYDYELTNDAPSQRTDTHKRSIDDIFVVNGDATIVRGNTHWRFFESLAVPFSLEGRHINESFIFKQNITIDKINYMYHAYENYIVIIIGPYYWKFRGYYIKDATVYPKTLESLGLPKVLNSTSKVIPNRERRVTYILNGDSVYELDETTELVKHRVLVDEQTQRLVISKYSKEYGYALAQYNMDVLHHVSDNLFSDDDNDSSTTTTTVTAKGWYRSTESIVLYCFAVGLMIVMLWCSCCRRSR